MPITLISGLKPDLVIRVCSSSTVIPTRQLEDTTISYGTLEYNSDESYNYGFVISTDYISEIGHELNKKHPELDLIIILGRNSLSYRTIHENVRCDLIAKKFGGGGHPISAGSPIDFSLITNALLI